MTYPQLSTLWPTSAPSSIQGSSPMPLRWLLHADSRQKDSKPWETCSLHASTPSRGCYSNSNQARLQLLIMAAGCLFVGLLPATAGEVTCHPRFTVPSLLHDAVGHPRQLGSPFWLIGSPATVERESGLNPGSKIHRHASVDKTPVITGTGTLSPKQQVPSDGNETTDTRSCQ